MNTSAEFQRELSDLAIKLYRAEERVRLLKEQHIAPASEEVRRIKRLVDRKIMEQASGVQELPMGDG